MSRRPLRLLIGTPEGLVVERDVESITAEDRSGWLGILPGREDLVAILPPGLLVFRDAEGEAYVAVAGGLLELRAGVCRVLVRDAIVERDLDSVAGNVEALRRERREAGDRRRSMVDDLAREAMRRLALEVRS